MGPEDLGPVRLRRQEHHLPVPLHTDGGLHFEGPFLDDIAITADGANVLTDTVENGDNGWTANGFKRMGGSTSEVVQHFYLAENRVYNGYDKTLKTGPYNFGWANTRPDWVERFPYQNGLLVTYVDGQYADNNTSAHPGHGQVLPVDAHYLPIKFPNGTLLGNRRQPFDATFGQEKTDAVTFHLNGVATTVKSSRRRSRPSTTWTRRSTGLRTTRRTRSRWPARAPRSRWPRPPTTRQDMLLKVRFDR